MKSQLLSFTRLGFDIIASAKSLQVGEETFVVFPIKLFGDLENMVEASTKLLEENLGEN